MKKFILISFEIIFCFYSYAQNIGIGTATPHANALMHVDIGASQTKGFLVTGKYAIPSTVPDLDSGSHLMFYPGKSAFRAGTVTGIQWNNVNVGHYSVAMGYNTIAMNSGSTAMGFNTTASGLFSTSIGRNTIASGEHSTAMGLASVASGPESTAMGITSTASGFASTALGSRTIASGHYSFAAGTLVSTNNRSGAFFFGDSDPYGKGVRSIGFNDQFAARFNGGYYFISSNAGADIGVQVLAGGNAWVSMCDESRKENFEPLNGDEILQKIKDIKLSSWNYKTQDPKLHRHYGIMAQDFYHAFGNDKYGAIGNDTTVNPIDMIGIDMAAIQALEKRTALLNEELKIQKASQAERLGKAEKQIAELTSQNADLAKRLQQLEAFVLRQNKENTITKN